MFSEHSRRKVLKTDWNFIDCRRDARIRLATVNTRCHVASISNPLPLEPQQLSASVAIRAPLPEFATT
jgi:hypothetical protein